MHPNGQLPAYEWNFSRRQSARPRLGRLARLQDRPAHDGHGRPRLPRARLPQAAAQLHVVGQPQGHRRPQRLPGRLPRARQHRRVRPLAAAARRRPSRAGRRHRLDGHVLPQRCWRSRSSWRARTPSTRTSRPSSSSTSCYIAGALNDLGGTGIPLWDDEDEFFYDVLHLGTGEVLPLQGALARRASSRCWRSRRSSPTCSSGCPSSASGWTGS